MRQTDRQTNTGENITLPIADTVPDFGPSRQTNLHCEDFITGPHCPHAVHRCDPFVIVSHVYAWSLCLCVGRTDELRKNGWTDRDVIWGQTLMGPMILVKEIRCGSKKLTRGAAQRLGTAMYPQTDSAAAASNRRWSLLSTIALLLALYEPGPPTSSSPKRHQTKIGHPNKTH